RRCRDHPRNICARTAYTCRDADCIRGARGALREPAARRGSRIPDAARPQAGAVAMNDPDVLFPWEKDGGDSDHSGTVEREDSSGGIDAGRGAEADGSAPEPVEAGNPAETRSFDPVEAAEAGAEAADGDAGTAAVGPSNAGEPASDAADAAPAAAGADGSAREPGEAGTPAETSSSDPVDAAEAGAEAADGDAATAAVGPSNAGDPASDAADTATAAAGADAVTDDAHSAGQDDDSADDDDSRFDVLDTEYARQAAERASAALREKPIAQKEYYSISEVCELVGLKPHALRYWETQFQVLNPSKNRSGNRVYQRKEIRLISLVKRLLYEEKYTVEGAKAKLDQLRRTGELTDTAGAVLDRAMIEQLRADLSELTTLLTPPART